MNTPDVRFEGRHLIYVTLPPSEGSVHEEWAGKLEAHGCALWHDAKAVLSAAHRIPVAAGFVHRIVILRGCFWGEDADRNTEAVKREGSERGWFDNHIDAVCLMRKYVSDEEIRKMGLGRIVGIHDPVSMGSDRRLLTLIRHSSKYLHDKGNVLGTRWARKGDTWDADDGFAFSLVSVQ